DISSIHKSISEPKNRIPRSKRIADALSILKNGNISPFDFILEILDETKSDYWGYRTAFYKESNSKLATILETILASSAGHDKLMAWMRPHAIRLVQDIVEDEMDNINESGKVSSMAEALTPECIHAWDMSQNTVQTPVLNAILFSAAQTSRAREENKRKRPDATCNMVITQLRYQRSNRSLRSQAILGIFLWSNGCSRHTIDALHRCGISVSYSSVVKSIEDLANHSMLLAITAALTLCFAFCYDDITTRGARGSTNVTSGIFGVVYKLRNATPGHMKLGPILERSRQAGGLDFNRDLRPTHEQLGSFQSQLKVLIVRVLTTYSASFSHYKAAPLLQHIPRRQMPSGHVTEFFPIRATTTEESTVRGDINYHDDVFLNQLKLTAEQLSDVAIPSFNDQLTNSRIRSAQMLRACDVNPYARRQFLQLAPGLFNMQLNLIWGLLHTHRGVLASTGSLAYFFSLLDKKRLNGERPDFHGLHTALKQIFDGIILNAWRTETGYQDLSQYASDKKPIEEDLLEMAEKIICNYATPLVAPLEIEYDDEGSDSELGEQSDMEVEIEESIPRVPGAVSSQFDIPTTIPQHAKDPRKDVAHQNIRLLTRDLMYVMEFTRATSDGDFGRIEDILPQLAMLFRGMGGNKYCSEILHFIRNLKHVWTPEFANIMRDNSLINVSGLDGQWMGVDRNIKHLIGDLKELLQAKGSEKTWDRLLGNASASIHLIKVVKKRVARTLNSSYQSKTPVPPNLDHLVWLVADEVRNGGLDIYDENRPKSSKTRAVPDVLAVGEHKIKSSSLASFNRSLQSFVTQSEEESDDEGAGADGQSTTLDGVEG
ncbi:hypothetical protein CVT24_000134, partial [Panaeolus cyanescens]